MKCFLLLLIYSLCSTLVFGRGRSPRPFKLFCPGGQSNMDGYGYNPDLPGSPHTTFKNVWISRGNFGRYDVHDGGRGIWGQSGLKHGCGFSGTNIQNNFTGRFGVGLSFAAALQRNCPDYKITIIKYSCGGTSLDSAARSFGNRGLGYHLRYGTNHHDQFLTTPRNANRQRDIDGDGINGILIPQGAAWVQGESDAGINKEVALHCYCIHGRMMDL